MVYSRCIQDLRSEVVKMKDVHEEVLFDVLVYMMRVSESIVDEYKRSRDQDKNASSRFRFWTYVPSVERGSSSVVIRWRKYSGRGRRSDPVLTSGLVDYKLPMARFPHCTRAEKRAIVRAESRFSKIRKINAHLLTINQAHKALTEIVAARDVLDDYAMHYSVPRPHHSVIEVDDRSDVAPAAEFTEADRIAFRRKIGLDH